MVKWKEGAGRVLAAYFGRILCIALAALMLAGCGAPAATAASPEPSPAPTAMPTADPAPTAKPRSELRLTGGDILDWVCGVPFEDPGCVALDAGGGDMTDTVTTEGEVVCWKLGDYQLSYEFTDKSGKQLSARRIVHVRPAELPETVVRDKVIYLTFDDGPCGFTRDALDTLDKYGAKVTFFIVAGNKEEYLELLPEIKERGHNIGIHCYSHDYGWLYRSEEGYFEDLMSAQKVVYQYTGEYADVCRFPGGSTTAGYLTGTMEGGYEQLNEMLHNMGMRYYDWNIQPENRELGSTGTAVNFRVGVPGKETPVCLQHDTRVYSVLALEEMLAWGIENGYSFEALDNTVPEVHFY